MKGTTTAVTKKSSGDVRASPSAGSARASPSTTTKKAGSGEILPEHFISLRITLSGNIKRAAPLRLKQGPFFALFFMLFEKST